MNTSLSFAGNSSYLTYVRLQHPQEQRAADSYECVQHFRIHTTVWLPVLGVFDDVRADVDMMHVIAHKGLYGHRERVCTES